MCAFYWKNHFMMIFIESDHIGHNFLRPGQRMQGALSRRNRSILQVVTEEDKSDDGGRSFIKQISLSEVEHCSYQTIYKGGGSSQCDQYIHIRHPVLQAFHGGPAQ